MKNHISRSLLGISTALPLGVIPGLGVGGVAHLQLLTRQPARHQFDGRLLKADHCLRA